MISAGFLGVFFALQSGTLESVVYDTVLEETGDSDAFERTIGRVRLVESVALVASALAGGAIAAVAPLRATYFLTAPLLRDLGAGAAAVPGATACTRPKSGSSLRRQLGGHLPDDPGSGAAPGRRGADRGRIGPDAGHVGVRPPLAGRPGRARLPVRPALGGPHLGARAGRAARGAGRGSRGAWAVGLVAVAIVACCVVLALSHQALLVVGVQVLLTLLVVAVSIPVLRRLHDAVPSAIRAGVASGVGTLTWLTFVPFALVVRSGQRARRRGPGRLALGGDRGGRPRC